MNGPRLAFLAFSHVLPGAAFALPPDTLTVVVPDATPCRPVPGATVTVGCASRRTGVGGACRAGRTRAAERVAIQPPHAARQPDGAEDTPTYVRGKNASA